MKRGVFALAALTLLAACASSKPPTPAPEAIPTPPSQISRVDTAHVWVTTGGPPAGRPFTILGTVKYSEPYSTDAIDATKMEANLKRLAIEKFPDAVDALIKEDSEVSADGATITVSAVAIEYESKVRHSPNNPLEEWNNDAGPAL